MMTKEDNNQRASFNFPARDGLPATQGTQRNSFGFFFVCLCRLPSTIRTSRAHRDTYTPPFFVSYFYAQKFSFYRSPTARPSLTHSHSHSFHFPLEGCLMVQSPFL